MNTPHVFTMITPNGDDDPIVVTTTCESEYEAHRTAQVMGFTQHGTAGAATLYVLRAAGVVVAQAKVEELVQ